MKKLLLLTYTFLLISTVLFAQNTSISGTVTDKTTNQPLEYTNVTLYNSADSTLVNGMVTNNVGAFTFNSLKPGNYYIKARFIGYVPRTISNINLIRGQALNVGAIAINPNAKLLN